MRVFRLLRILLTVFHFGLDEIVLSSLRSPALARFVRVLTFGRHLSAPRAIRLRRALEDLGPLFVKFGQVLSTRRDLLPADVADEPAKLQDSVPPFASDVAVAEIERGLGRPLDQGSASFPPAPEASASFAQVTFAVLPGASRCGPRAARDFA